MISILVQRNRYHSNFVKFPKLWQYVDHYYYSIGARSKLHDKVPLTFYLGELNMKWVTGKYDASVQSISI